MANLPASIAQRELTVIGDELGFAKDELRTLVVDSAGPGNLVAIELEYENVVEVITAFGERGLSAERVAEAAVREARDYLAHDAPVGPHLADQLLLPLACAGGAFRTGPLTLHTRTNLDVIERFLPNTAFELEDDGHYTTTVRCRTRARLAGSDVDG